MDTNETPVVITGTIDRESYESIGKYMMTTKTKLFIIGVTAAAALVMLGIALFRRDAGMVIGPVLMIALGVWFYLRWKRDLPQNVIARTPGIRDGKHFDLELTFAPDALRLHNRTTRMDTAFDYSVFSSYAETDNCVALFVKTGTYLLVPKGNMKPGQMEAMLRVLQEKCPGIKKRK